MRYEELAAELNTKVGALYSLAANEGNPLHDIGQARPIGQGQRREFTDEEVAQIKNWWAHNQRTRAMHDLPDEPFVDVKGMLAYMGWKPSTLRYYYDRYGKPVPDFRMFNAGKGQPKAMYLTRKLDELKAWIAAGKPEPHEIRYVLADREGFKSLVVFRDGVKVGFRADGEIVTFPHLSEAEAASYIEMAEVAERGRGRKLKQRRLKLPDPPPPPEGDPNDGVLLVWGGTS